MAVALVVVVVTPFYLVDHVYLPRLRRCEYGYTDFSLIDNTEAWWSYLVAPVAAALLAFVLVRLTSRKWMWSAVAAVGVLVVMVTGLALVTGGTNCGD